jgi:hypothetical protein
LIAGAGVAAGLVIALMVSLLGEGVPTTEIDQLAEKTDASTTIPAPTTSIPTTTTVLVNASEDVREAGEAALEAWGRFAGSGDLAILHEHFHPLSPQLTLLAAKAAALTQAPLDESPYSFVMTEPLVNLQSSRLALMQGTVITTRGEETLSELDWRLTFAWSEETESWLVWTIEEVV